MRTVYGRAVRSIFQFSTQFDTLQSTVGVISFQNHLKKLHSFLVYERSFSQLISDKRAAVQRHLSIKYCDQMQEEPEVGTLSSRFSSRWQYILDKLIPHTASRWISFSLCLYVYILRVYFLNGWYIVTYGLGIYLLNQLLGFIQPQVCTSFLLWALKMNPQLGLQETWFSTAYDYFTSTLNLLLYSVSSLSSNGPPCHQFDPDDADLDLGLPVSNTDEFRCETPLLM